MHHPTICMLCLSVSIAAQINYDAGVEHGRITFYDQTPVVACDIPQSEWPVYTAAISEKHFQNGLACGATARLINGGKEIRVMIVDLCPVQGNEEWCSGDMTHFDLGGSATFSQLENPVTGVKQVDFEWLPTPVGNNPVKLRYKDGINQWWVAIQVVNHRYPVAKLEIKDPSSGVWITGNRTRPGMWNYWQFDFTGNGLKAPYQIRITDQYGQSIEETATVVRENYLWTGMNQFPLLGRHGGVPVSRGALNPPPDNFTCTLRKHTLYLSSTGSISTVGIHDMHGKAITSFTMPPGAQHIALPALMPGMYTLSIRSPGIHHTLRWHVLP